MTSEPDASLANLPAPIPRRQFIKLSGGTLLLLGGYGLYGCGGSGSHSSGGISSASGSIQFPAGFTQNLGALSIGNGGGFSTVGAKQTFAAKTLGSKTSLVYVQDTQSRVIYLGFVTPGTANVVGPASTAAALIYFALEAYAADPSNLPAVVTLIEENSATATVASVIATRMLSNPYALSQSDSQICAALAQAVTSIKGASGSIRRGNPATSSTSGDLLTIDGAAQSGFTVNASITQNAFTGQNSYRRYCRVYVYQTGTVDSSGNQNNYTAAKLTGTPLDVPSVQRLNLVTAVGDIFTSSSPFSPIATTPIALPMVSGVNQTLYDIIVIGSSGLSAEPAFFSASNYAGEVAGWKSELQTLQLRSAMFDVFFGLILNLLGVTSLNAISLSVVDQAIANLQAGSITAFNAAIEQAVADYTFYAPVQYAYQLFKGGSISAETAFVDVVFDSYDFLMREGNAAAAAFVSKPTFQGILAVGFRTIMGALSGASLILGAVDLAAVVYDLGHAQIGSSWQATLQLPSIKITPTSVAINPGVSNPPEFTAAPPADVTGTFVWTWTLTGEVGAQLTDENGHQGTTLTQISSVTVYLLATPLDTHDMAVTVEGFQVASNGDKTSIGKAVASVTVSSTTTIKPSYVTIVMQDFVLALAAFTPASGGTNYSYAVKDASGYNVLGCVFENTIQAGSVHQLSPNDLWSNDQYDYYAPAEDASYTGYGVVAYNLGTGLVGFLFGTYQYANFEGSGTTSDDGLSTLAAAWAKNGPGVITVNDSRFRTSPTP